MSFQFQRPVGAVADLKELEYISALHQTDQCNIRADGSIYAKDISNFLCSRYGIKVSDDEVRRTIIKGFGGGDEDEECIDLTELVAILIIPLLLKASKLRDHQRFMKPITESRELSKLFGRPQTQKSSKSSLPTPVMDTDSFTATSGNIIDDVLAMILLNTTGSPNPKKLNKYLVKDILLAYGEKEIADDEKLIEDMVSAAKGTNRGGIFDSTAFARALTHDITEYDVMNEKKMTSYYFDVFETNNLGMLQKEIKKEKSEIDVEALDGLTFPQSVYTAAAIDEVAGTYCSKALVTFLWASFILTYFAYFYDVHISQDLAYCTTEERNEFGCLIANGIVNWLIILVQLCFLGIVYMGLGSLGNSLEWKTPTALIIGMISISIFTYMPYHLTQNHEETSINYTKAERIDGFLVNKINFFRSLGRNAALYDHVVFHMAMILGCLTCTMQLWLLLGHVVNRLSIRKREWVKRYFTPGCILFESKLKLASAHKMNLMVRNAHEIHKISQQESSTSKSKDLVATSYGKALLAFDKLSKRTETVGGFLWTWKQVLSGEIFTTEGTWLSGRLLAGNLSQLLISVFILIFGICYTNNIAQNMIRTVLKVFLAVMPSNSQKPLTYLPLSLLKVPLIQ